jgi:hypothetical protein
VPFPSFPLHKEKILANKILLRGQFFFLLASSAGASGWWMQEEVDDDDLEVHYKNPCVD